MGLPDRNSQCKQTHMKVKLNGPLSNHWITVLGIPGVNKYVPFESAGTKLIWLVNWMWRDSSVIPGGQQEDVPKMNVYVPFERIGLIPVV